MISDCAQVQVFWNRNAFSKPIAMMLPTPRTSMITAVGMIPGRSTCRIRCKPAGAVDPGRLVQRRVDAGQSGQVDDRGVPGGLPDVGPDIDVPEVVRVRRGSRPAGRRSNPSPSLTMPEPRRQHQDRHRDDHDGGDEVRRVRHHLHRPFEHAVADLVQRERQDDRDREARRTG